VQQSPCSQHSQARGSAPDCVAPDVVVAHIPVGPAEHVQGALVEDSAVECSSVGSTRAVAAAAAARVVSCSCWRYWWLCWWQLGLAPLCSLSVEREEVLQSGMSPLMAGSSHTSVSRSRQYRSMEAASGLKQPPPMTYILLPTTSPWCL
jgi:hypothetical protein